MILSRREICTENVGTDEAKSKQGAQRLFKAKRNAMVHAGWPTCKAQQAHLAANDPFWG